MITKNRSHTNKTQIDLDIEMNTNIQNLTCLGNVTMFVHNKQQLSNI